MQKKINSKWRTLVTQKAKPRGGSKYHGPTHNYQLCSKKHKAGKFRIAAHGRKHQGVGYRYAKSRPERVHR